MFAHSMRFDHPLFWHRLGLGAIFSLIALVAKSDPFSTPWVASGNGKAQMRLIVGTQPGAGRYAVAAEIKLGGQAITYWRTPGDAGVPPTFSFAGSINLGRATVAYPAPSRINEQGLDAFGYREDVIFPIAVTARDPGKPVTLRVTLDYAVCDNICLPARGVALLQLPQKGTSGEEQIIARAQARVPVPLAKGLAAKKIVIASDPGVPSRWIAKWNGEKLIDVFAEAPDGWDIEAHRLDDKRFSLTMVQQPLDKMSTRAEAQLTLTTPQHAYTFPVDLARPAPASRLGTK